MSPTSGQPTDEGSAQDSESGVTRRRILATGVATWTTVALAGCNTTDSDTTTGATTDTTTATATTTTATPEPQPENYVVTAETGTGSVPEGVTFASSCSATRRFVPGMMVTFMVGIYDPETGEQLTDEEIESASVVIDGGSEVELAWAGDDEENPAQEWGGSWDIPEDTEPGTYSYTVEVTVADGEANFHTVGILEDAFEVVQFDDPLNYVVTTETFYEGGPDGLPGYTNGFVGSCAPERQFTNDFDVTFKIGIYDADSGDFVGTDALDAVEVVSSNGAFDPIALEYFPGEGENTSEKWQGSLDTENLSPGTYEYEVEVTMKNEDEEYLNVGIASNAFTIIEVPTS